MLKTLLLVIVMASALIVACDGSMPESSNSHDLGTEERTLIDNQAANIDLLAQNMKDYCDAMGRLEALPRLARSDIGKAYAMNKQASLRARLNEKAHDLLAKAASKWLTQQNISKAFVAEVGRVYGTEWEIVSSSNAQPDVEFYGNEVKLRYVYQPSLRDRVFLGSDKFMTKKGVLSVNASPDCYGKSRSGVRAVFTVKLAD